MFQDALDDLDVIVVPVAASSSSSIGGHAALGSSKSFSDKSGDENSDLDEEVGDDLDLDENGDPVKRGRRKKDGKVYVIHHKSGDKSVPGKTRIISRLPISNAMRIPFLGMLRFCRLSRHDDLIISLLISNAHTAALVTFSLGCISPGIFRIHRSLLTER